MDGIQLRVGDLIYGVKKHFSLIIVLTLVGLALGIVLSGISYLQGTMSRDYEITASAVFSTRARDGKYLSKDNAPNRDDVAMALTMIDMARYVLRSTTLLDKVIENKSLIGISARNISSNLRVTQYSQTPILEMTLTWRSAEEGMMILEGILSIATSQAQSMFGRGAFTVINPPAAKYIVGGSMNIPIWGIMAVLGAFTGVGVAMLEIMLRPTLINTKDVSSEFDLEVLGVVDDNPALRNPAIVRTEEGLVMPENAQEDFSASTYILRNRLGTKSGCHRIYLTSSTRGEGTTTVACYTAFTLSEMEHKVLLIDLDFRNPGVGSIFMESVDFSKTMNSLYRGEVDVQEAITSVTPFLDVLPAVLEHKSVPLDNNMFELLEKLSDGYDYLILNAPPVGEASYTLAINQIVEAAVIVIGFDKATKREIKETLSKMDKSGVRILGAIVNGDKSVDSDNIFSTSDEGKKGKKKQKRRKRAVSGGAMRKASGHDPIPKGRKRPEKDAPGGRKKDKEARQLLKQQEKERKEQEKEQKEQERKEAKAAREAKRAEGRGLFGRRSSRSQEPEEEEKKPDLMLTAEETGAEESTASSESEAPASSQSSETPPDSESTAASPESVPPAEAEEPGSALEEAPDTSSMAYESVPVAPAQESAEPAPRREASPAAAPQRRHHNILEEVSNEMNAGDMSEDDLLEALYSYGKDDDDF